MFGMLILAFITIATTRTSVVLPDQVPARCLDKNPFRGKTISLPQWMPPHIALEEFVTRCRSRFRGDGFSFLGGRSPSKDSPFADANVSKDILDPDCTGQVYYHRLPGPATLFRILQLQACSHPFQTRGICHVLPRDAACWPFFASSL